MPQKKKPQQAQEITPAEEAQEATPAAARKSDLTEEETRLLRIAAAQKIGKPLEAVSLREAFSILQIEMPDKEERFSRATERAVDKFFQNMTQEQLDLLYAAAQHSDNAYKQALAAHIGGVKSAAETLREIIEESWINDPDIRQGLADLAGQARKVMSELNAFLQSDTYKTIKEGLVSFERAVNSPENAAFFSNLQLFGEQAAPILELAPYLQIALAEAKADPLTAEKYKDTTEEDFLLLPVSFFLQENPDTDSEHSPIIARAWQLKEEHDSNAAAIEELERAAKDLPRIISNPTELLNMPLDKVNSNLWHILSHAKDDGQIGFDLELVTSKKGKAQEAIVYAGINFAGLSDMTITRQLTPYDKRVHMAAAALYNGGNSIISATQIYKMMGNKGQPKSADVKRINDSLDKMGAARVYINSTEEVKINKGYPSFKYDASLLPFERISAYINNTLCDTAIHLFREPPLMTFARQRSQITQVTRQLLESPVNKTDANLRLDDYLIERIGHMKAPKSHSPRKILFSTIYEKCGITTIKQKQRAPQKIRKYLDWYKETGFISGYTEDKDGITILL